MAKKTTSTKTTKTVVLDVTKIVKKATKVFTFKGNDEILVTSDTFCNANDVIKQTRLFIEQRLTSGNIALLPDELKILIHFETKDGKVEFKLNSCVSQELFDETVSHWFSRLVFKTWYDIHHENLTKLVNKEGKQVKNKNSVIDGRAKERIILSRIQSLNAQRIKELAKLKEDFAKEWEAIKASRQAKK